MDAPVLGSLRYDDIRPLTTPHNESNEKLPISGKGEVPQAETNYPTGYKLLLITLAVCLAIFVMALGALSTTLLPRDG